MDKVLFEIDGNKNDDSHASFTEKSGRTENDKARVGKCGFLEL